MRTCTWRNVAPFLVLAYSRRLRWLIERLCSAMLAARLALSLSLSLRFLDLSSLFSCFTQSFSLSLVFFGAEALFDSSSALQLHVMDSKVSVNCLYTMLQTCTQIITSYFIVHIRDTDVHTTVAATYLPSMWGSLRLAQQPMGRFHNVPRNYGKITKSKILIDLVIFP